MGPFKRSKENEKISDAEILSNQYKKVFTEPDPNYFFDSPNDFFKDVQDESNPHLTQFLISQELVSRAIDSLSAKAAPGPDGIPPILLKQLKWEIAPVLSTLFQSSTESGIVPTQFLTALVKPIRKPKKKRSDPASYRPVSLTSNLAKIQEHIIKFQLQEYIEENSKLDTAQHGFRKS